MNVWEILELGPTDDESAIKRAYAKKLKIYHPEDDPQGYQKLREAYDGAIKQAKYLRARKLKGTVPSAPINSGDTGNALESDTPHSDDTGDDSQDRVSAPKVSLAPGNINFENPHKIIPHADLVNAGSYHDAEDQNTEFLRNIKALYDDFDSRIEPDNWRRALDCNAVWNITNRTRLNEIILDFIEEHHYLPQEVWKLLDDHFKWSEQEAHVTQYVRDYLVLYILRQLRLPKALSFTYVKSGGIDFEKYLEYREKAFFALYENNLNVVGLNLERAKEIYDNDPELYRIEGQFFFRSGDYAAALIALNHLLDRIPDDTDCLLLRAGINEKLSCPEQAISDYNRVLDLMPDNAKVLSAAARCCLDAGHPDIARRHLLRLFILRYQDAETKTLLARANILTREKLKNELKEDPGNRELIKKLSEIDSELKFRVTEKIKGIKERLPGKKYLPGMLFVLFFCGLIALILFLVNIQPKEKQESDMSIATPRSANGTVDVTDWEEPPVGSEVAVKAQDLICLSLSCEFDNNISDSSKPVFNPAVYEKPQDLLAKEWVCIGRIGGREYLFVIPAFVMATKLNLDVPGIDGDSQTPKGVLYDLKGNFYDFVSEETIKPVLDEMKKSDVPGKIIDSLDKNRYFHVGEQLAIPEVGYTRPTRSQTPWRSLLGPVAIIILIVSRAANRSRR